ncbi:MAG: addiction module protein [Pseudomonadota bacterium]
MKQSDIEKMSVDEKLQAMEALWSALDDDDVDAPDWHEPILQKRVEALESGQEECIPLDVVKRRKFNG